MPNRRPESNVLHALALAAGIGASVGVSVGVALGAILARVFDFAPLASHAATRLAPGLGVVLLFALSQFRND